MNATTTAYGTATAPRTIDPRAYHAARAEGLPPLVAAYAARPPVLALDWDTDRHGDAEEVATFELDGRTFRAEAVDPRAVEGDCIGCRELVEAYNRQDDGYAWITPDEFDAMNHAALTVCPADEDGNPTGPSASLWGVCTLDRTPTERRMAERYVAETVAELAAEALRAEEIEQQHTAERRAARVAELRGYYLAALDACSA